MSNDAPTALILGGTGRSGSLLAAGAPAAYAMMLRGWLTGAIVAGHGSVPSGDVAKVTGREPTAFRAFAERNARAWTVEGK